MSNDKQETIPMGKTAYSRKAKHKTPEWGSFFTPKVKI